MESTQQTRITEETLSQRLAVLSGFILKDNVKDDGRLSQPILNQFLFSYSNISADVVFQRDGKQCDGAGCFVAEHWELQRPDRGE